MLTILYKNQDFLVAIKPAGLNFHSEDGEAGFVALLTQQLEQKLGQQSKQQSKLENSFSKLYPVHRLDKMTSGICVFALNKTSAQTFQQLFSERKIEKFYLAISTQKPKKKQGWIKGDMQAARNGSWKLVKQSDNPAITQFISVSTQPGERVFLVKPHTGKTHQIRVALKSLGAPIAGDVRYSNKLMAKQEGRGYLHAYSIRFTFNDQIYCFTQSPTEGERFLSEPFTNVLLNWAEPWCRFTKE